MHDDDEMFVMLIRILTWQQANVFMCLKLTCRVAYRRDICKLL